jgi:hypothetical protein
MTREADERRHFLAERADLVGSAEVGQIDDERATDNLGSGLFEKLDGGEAGASGGDEIVDDDDVLASLDGVLVDLDAVRAVFERVVLADDVPRQLALLSHGDEAYRELMRDGAAQDEPARLDARDLVDANAGAGLN